MLAARTRVHEVGNHLTRRSLSTDSTSSVTLYQYAICPFCHKTKALLAYTNVEHSIVEVNPLTKAEIKWSEDYKKVPIAKVNGKPLCGSDAIIDGLLADPFVVENLENKWRGTKMTMETFQGNKAKEWVTFANEELASLLYPNICRSLTDSYQAFGYVDGVETFSAWQRLTIRSLGSIAMYFAASRVKSKCQKLLLKKLS